MGKSKIEWTERTWNPVRGCSRISPGCVNCYAERMAARVSAYGANPDSPFAGFVEKKNGHASWTGKVELIEDKLFEPLDWKVPSVVFANSMSDLFHEALDFIRIDRVFAVMAMAKKHTFQVLTKRADRLREYMNNPGTRTRVERQIELWCWEHARTGKPLPGKDRAKWQGFLRLETWPLPNVWLGVSVENQEYANKRIPELLNTPAAVRFISYEPALGPVRFKFMRAYCSGCKMPALYSDNPLGSFKASSPLVDEARRSVWCQGCGFTYDDVSLINWVIVGGESGPGARPFDIGWAKSTVAQCQAAGVAVFVKQLGADPREGNANGNCRDLACTHPDCGYIRLKLKDRKGGDMNEWATDLRVREMPR